MMFVPTIGVRRAGSILAAIGWLGAWPTFLIGDTPQTIRCATFNVALNRPSAGRLAQELRGGKSEPAKAVAEIIQRVQPDLILLNELDYDPEHLSVSLFCESYLAVSQNGALPAIYPYRFTAPVNTGVPSKVDLDRDGNVHGPTDAYGYGAFPGQYGMAVLSKFPIDQASIRTFRMFLWKDMPDAMLPHRPGGDPFYDDEVLAIMRLSSKSHWDVPIHVTDQLTLHVLASHPTPPVFDGPEDRNGTRNHDEIRFLADYVDPNKSEYIYDDNGVKGGLSTDAKFLILGDLNADPHDGDSTQNPIQQLLGHSRIEGSTVPISQGGKEQAQRDGGMNLQHQGPAEADTGDFPDERTGNLRVDYVLPSRNLRVVASGVYWPPADEPESQLVKASDHRLVWVDLAVE